MAAAISASAQQLQLKLEYIKLQSKKEIIKVSKIVGQEVLRVV